MRNLAIALGNWGSEKAFPALAQLFADENPLIRGHAAWGLGRNSSPEATELLKAGKTDEHDETVLEEIDMALRP